jgi:hypothetical protein
MPLAPLLAIVAASVESVDLKKPSSAATLTGKAFSHLGRATSSIHSCKYKDSIRGNRNLG